MRELTASRISAASGMAGISFPFERITKAMPCFSCGDRPSFFRFAYIFRRSRSFLLSHNSRLFAFFWTLFAHRFLTLALKYLYFHYEDSAQHAKAFCLRTLSASRSARISSRPVWFRNTYTAVLHAARATPPACLETPRDNVQPALY